LALLAALPLVPRPAGFIGSLTNAGVDEREAPIYAEGVRRGGTLVAARVDDDEVARRNASGTDRSAARSPTR